MIVAPGLDLPAPIVLTAWGTMLQLSFVDSSKMGAFVGQYSSRGPSNEICPVVVDESA